MPVSLAQKPATTPAVHKESAAAKAAGATATATASTNPAIRAHNGSSTFEPAQPTTSPTGRPPSPSRTIPAPSPGPAPTVPSTAAPASTGRSAGDAHDRQDALATTTPTIPTTTTKPPSGPDGDSTLGALSKKYESHGPGTVSTGKGDPGGVSYGSYQLSTKRGTCRSFVSSLKTSHPDYYKALSGSKPGTQAFTKAWKDLAKKDPSGFDAAQHDFIKKTLYEPAASDLKKSGLDVSKRSAALRDVVWSSAVQHGARGANDIIKTALHGRKPSAVSDAQLIKDIYAERGRKNPDGTLAHFPSSTTDVQAGVANRYRNEQRDALAMLAKER